MNRLRTFLKVEADATVARALGSLWEYREGVPPIFKQDVASGHQRLLEVIARLSGSASPAPPSCPAPPPVNISRVAQLRDDLMALSQLAPHPRGYAFQTFLRELFDAYGMEGRESFRLRGEEIDGSFMLDGQPYLLEAKWTSGRIGQAELHTFHGKLEQKASWARGLFISQSGFSSEGLDAFGRAKRIICMDGYDLYEMLNRGLSFQEVLSRKVRRAAETGNPFCSIRELY